MLRISALHVTLFVLSSLFLAVLSSPIPIQDINVGGVEEARDLERRATHTGRTTWFNVGLGNCGKRSQNSEPVVAMSKAFYDSNKGSNCGQWIEIIDKKTRRKAYGQLWDSCQSCKWDDIDLSPSLFQKFAPLGQGVFTAEWHFMAKGWKP